MGKEGIVLHGELAFQHVGHEGGQVGSVWVENASTVVCSVKLCTSPSKSLLLFFQL